MFKSGQQRVPPGIAHDVPEEQPVKLGGQHTSGHWAAASAAIGNAARLFYDYERAALWLPTTLCHRTPGNAYSRSDARCQSPSPGPPADLPPVDDWRTTDQDEITRRRLRAREEAPRIENRDGHGSRSSRISTFIRQSGVTYSVEIRDLARRQFSCDCVDFRVNGLGTCKHVEAVLEQLETRLSRGICRRSLANGSPRIDLGVPDRARAGPPG